MYMYFYCLNSLHIVAVGLDPHTMRGSHRSSLPAIHKRQGSDVSSGMHAQTYIYTSLRYAEGHSSIIFVLIISY